MSGHDLTGVVAAGRRRLEGAGLDARDAQRDAVLLMRSLLGWSAADWLARPAGPVEPGLAARFDALIERRTRFEPVAYLIGEREFYGRTFHVTPDVLIPRPETELVIEDALRLAGERGAAPRVVDVGTGSGCLAVTLAIELPGARVIATDISTAALEVARQNARALGVVDRIEWRAGSWLAGITQPVDLIVTNPPYVADSERDALPKEVLDYEPPRALFGGGADGLDAVRALLPEAARVLAPGGAVVIEIGRGQHIAVRRLIEQTAGLAWEQTRPDLQGIPRVVVATRP